MRKGQFNLNKLLRNSMEEMFAQPHVSRSSWSVSVSPSECLHGMVCNNLWRPQLCVRSMENIMTKARGKSLLKTTYALENNHILITN